MSSWLRTALSGSLGRSQWDSIWTWKRVHFKNLPLFIRNTTTFVNELINILDEVTCLFFCILIGCQVDKPQKFDHNYFLRFHPKVNQVIRVSHSSYDLHPMLRSSSTIIINDLEISSDDLKTVEDPRDHNEELERPGNISISTLFISRYSRWQVLIYRFYNEDTKDCNQYCTIVHLKSCVNH